MMHSWYWLCRGSKVSGND